MRNQVFLSVNSMLQKSVCGHPLSISDEAERMEEKEKKFVLNKIYDKCRKSNVFFLRNFMSRMEFFHLSLITDEEEEEIEKSLNGCHKLN